VGSERNNREGPGFSRAGQPLILIHAGCPIFDPAEIGRLRMRQSLP